MLERSGSANRLSCNLWLWLGRLEHDLTLESVSVVSLGQDRRVHRVKGLTPGSQMVSLKHCHFGALLSINVFLTSNQATVTAEVRVFEVDESLGFAL